LPQDLPPRRAGQTVKEGADRRRGLAIVDGAAAAKECARRGWWQGRLMYA
jgi:hypothetical protein